MQRCICFTVFACFASVSCLQAQDYCQTYRVVERVVYEQQPVTSYRLDTQWVSEEKEITTYEDRWVTEYEKVTSYKPVFETSERMETRTVLKPVTETSTEVTYEDVVEYETVTETREETVLVPKTIRETKYRDEQVVQRVPVTQTINQQEAFTTYKPVTSYRTQMVDQGGFVDQIVTQPGATRTRLTWMQGQWNYNPATGANYYQRPGLHWVPMSAPPTYQVQRAYVPNVVAQQVPVTNYVPETIVQNRPVQVTQYVDQVTTRRVPFEEVRTEYERQVVQKPVTYQRPVTRRIEHKRPVTTTRWVEQTVQVPVKVQTVNYQTIVEEKPVQVLKRIPQVKKVQVQRPVTQWIKEESVRNVPRTVTMRVPLDMYGNPIYAPAPTTTERRIIEPAPAASPAADSGQSGGEPSAADTAPAISKEDAEKAAEQMELKGADGEGVSKDDGASE